MRSFTLTATCCLMGMLSLTNGVAVLSAQDVVSFAEDPALVRPKRLLENLEETLGPLPLLFLEEAKPQAAEKEATSVGGVPSSNRPPSFTAEPVAHQQLAPDVAPLTISPQNAASIVPRSSLPQASPSQTSSSLAPRTGSNWLTIQQWQEQQAASRLRIHELAAREAEARAKRLAAKRQHGVAAPNQPPFSTQPISQPPKNWGAEQPPQFTKW